MKSNDSKLILFGQVASGLMSFVSVTLTAKYVGAEVFGFCSVVVLLLIVGMALADFGACAWVGRELASKSISIATYRHVMKSKTQINLIFLPLAPGIFFFAPENFRLTSILVIYPVLWNRFNFVQQFLIATNKIKESVCLIILERSCWLLIIPLSLLKIEKTLAYSIPILFGLFLQGIFGNRLLSSQESNEIPDRKLNQLKLFQQSRYFGVTSLSGVISNLDALLVATVSSFTESANYILAQRFRNPLTIGFSSVATRIRPIAAKRNLQLIRRAFREDANLLKLSFLINILFSILLFFNSEFFLGTSFKGIGLILFFGSLTAIPLGVVSLSTSILNGIGYERYVSRANNIYLGFMLLGVGITAHYFGSFGAAIYVFLLVLIYAIASSLKCQQELRLLS